MGMDTEKIIQGFMLHISYQMRPYSSMKVVCLLTYTYFRLCDTVQEMPQFIATGIWQVVKGLQLHIFYLTMS